MEMRTLRYFVAAAQELNITRAAEKLNISQPPLSNQIHGLEDELGVTLFLRGKRGLQLTEEGVLLLQRARQILELADKTKAEIQELGGGISGTLCVGIIEGRAPHYMARWITGFREEYPLVRFSLWNGSSDDVLERLNRGLEDVALIAAPYDTEHLDGILVGSEPWAAILSRQHPLAQMDGDELPLSALVGQPLIVPSRKSREEAIRRWFAEICAEPDMICSTSNYLDALALSEQNAGISIFPQTTYTPSPLTVSKVITEPMKKIDYDLVWRRSDPLTELAETFVDYVRDFVEADLLHSERFRVRGKEYTLPEDVEEL